MTSEEKDRTLQQKQQTEKFIAEPYTGYLYILYYFLYYSYQSLIWYKLT